MRLGVLLSLLWSLVEVHSQTQYPHVFFMGENLPNNSYVNVALVGTAVLGLDYAIHCNSDLDGCCSSKYGPYRGDWYLPNEDKVQTYENEGFYASYENQSVFLHCGNIINAQSGIYQCVIEVAGLDEFDEAANKTMYVGLYRPYEGQYHCV